MPASTLDTVPRLTWLNISRLIRLPNQTGTWLLLLPTLWALVLSARGFPPWRLLVLFILGSFLMRSAGVVVNDLADRSFDRQVARTRQRPLASGALTSRHALAVLAVLLLLAALLVFQLNRLTILLSPIALVLAALYPFAKRVVPLPQAMLGIAFGWGTIMAWTASRGRIESATWLTFAATICWAVAYDTIYALQDRDDDRRIGVKSSAIFFGSLTWLAVGMAFGGMLLLLSLAGWLTQVGWLYYLVLLAIGFFGVLQVRHLRRNITASTALSMFQQHVWIGTAVLGGLLGGFLL